MMKASRATQRVTQSVLAILAAATVGMAFLGSPLNTRAAVTGSSSGGSASGVPLDSAAPTTQPGGNPGGIDIETPQRSVQDVMQEFQANSRQLNSVMPPKLLSDPAKRDEAAPKAIPVLYHRIALINELATTRKVPATQLASVKQNAQAMLYLLNDEPTVKKVKGMLESKDAVRQTEGQSVAISARWLGVGSDKAESKKVLDEVEKLDRAHPEDSKLTILTLGLAQSAHTQEENTRLLALVTDVMTDPYATKVKAQIAAQKKQQEETEAKQKSFMDKPFVIASTTVDGKDFTTESLKGKVVLVDFWATWCGPCKAGLPHVIETYNKYHEKGLEIVGISNDYDAKSLTDFTPKNDMPWVQLFDADAAANHQWNPLSQKYGVNGIPCMFLIDKKGVLRSVSAREEMDELIPKLLAE